MTHLKRTITIVSVQSVYPLFQLVKPRVPIDKHDGKTNAPPVSALNSLFSPQSPQGKSRPFVGSATILHNSHAEFDTRENGEMLQSPTQLDPFFQEGGEGGADPTWVTIFGFPTAAESFILRQFRSGLSARFRLRSPPFHAGFCT